MSLHKAQFLHTHTNFFFQLLTDILLVKLKDFTKFNKKKKKKKKRPDLKATKAYLLNGYSPFPKLISGSLSLIQN